MVKNIIIATLVLLLITSIATCSSTTQHKWDRESWEEGCYFGALYTLEIGHLPSMYHRDYVFNHHIEVQDWRDARMVDTLVWTEIYGTSDASKWDSIEHTQDSIEHAEFVKNVYNQTIGEDSSTYTSFPIIMGENDSIVYLKDVYKYNQSITDSNCVEIWYDDSLVRWWKK
jgi:hypothetical protein